MNQSRTMIKDPKISPRDDVKPFEGERQYGKGPFADETNKKYPVDTPEHVRAAWSYINHEDNAVKYAADEVEAIKANIQKAAKKHGIGIQAY